MSDVPPEIRYEILLRLPAASLYGFRGVCREWRRLIDDPSFRISHSHHQFTTHTLLIANPKGILYCLSLDYAVPIKQLLCRALPPFPSYRPLASCDGMFLLAVDEIWTIWNPFTRRCLQLPRSEPGLYTIARGFGYDSAAGDYKVVRIDGVSPGGAHRYRTIVYSLKLGRWKTIGDCPHYFSTRNEGVFVNGALHWIVKDLVMVLDLKGEEYGQLWLPPLPYTQDYCFLDLTALTGSLCLSYYNYKSECFDGWVVDDRNKWKKLFSIRNIQFVMREPSLRFIRYVPVAYLKSTEQVLLLRHDSGFVLVNLGDNQVSGVSFNGGDAKISTCLISADRFLHSLNF